jgi:hypothetical protein
MLSISDHGDEDSEAEEKLNTCNYLSTVNTVTFTNKGVTSFAYELSFLRENDDFLTDHHGLSMRNLEEDMDPCEVVKQPPTKAKNLKNL